MLAAARSWNLPEDCGTPIEMTVQAFRQLKEMRNAVVHSRVFDVRSAIANRVKPDGQIVEVLLTARSLDWLYGQLCELRSEIRAVLAMFDLMRNTAGARQMGFTGDPMPEVNEWRQRVVDCQQRRAQAGAAPTFPTS